MKIVSSHLSERLFVRFKNKPKIKTSRLDKKQNKTKNNNINKYIRNRSYGRWASLREIISSYRCWFVKLSVEVHYFLMTNILLHYFKPSHKWLEQQKGLGIYNAWKCKVSFNLNLFIIFDYYTIISRYVFISWNLKYGR